MEVPMTKTTRNTLFLIPLLLVAAFDGISLAQAIITSEMENRAIVIISSSIALLACLWIGGAIIKKRRVIDEES